MIDMRNEISLNSMKKEEIEGSYILFLHMTRMIEEIIEKKKKEKRKYVLWTSLLVDAERILGFYEDLISAINIYGE